MEKVYTLYIRYTAKRIVQLYTEQSFWAVQGVIELHKLYCVTFLISLSVLMSDNSNLRTLNAFRLEKGLVNQVYNENQLYTCG